MKFRFFLIIALLALWIAGFAQQGAPEDWFHLDRQKDGVPGMSIDKMYKELLKERQGKTVIVAVIDSGVDFEHEDLKDVMWINKGEIPGNGIDDDKNGYVDDIHGWNFIGNSKGENVTNDNLEMTRLYVQYKEKYENQDPSKLSKKERKEYDDYLKWDKIIKEKQEELAPNLALHGATLDAFTALRDALGKKPEDVSLEDLKNFKSSDMFLGRVAAAVAEFVSEGVSFAQILDEVQEAYDYYNSQVNYHYNPDFDPREIVGDNHDDPFERFYGNNDVKGEFSEHGTHVAGIIAAKRGNDIGMDGVADNVRIMALRAVPNGDERDKDVANAIIYAVDNGASVINMSFGKGASPYKEAVDKAVKYAMKHDVLIIHGAGNEEEEITFDNKFPNERFDKKGLFGPKYAESWIEVGAIYWEEGENLAAPFSNYSQERVHVFAPGMEIYSTVPEDNYKSLQGTSMAAPMVAGLAAVVRSYFPELTARQVKDIIIQSAVPYKGKVNKPGTDELVPFRQLSVSGGIVNGYEAVKLAMLTKGKKKGASTGNSSGKAAPGGSKEKNEQVKP